MKGTRLEMKGILPEYKSEIEKQFKIISKLFILALKKTKTRDDYLNILKIKEKFTKVKKLFSKNQARQKKWLK